MQRHGPIGMLRRMDGTLGKLLWQGPCRIRLRADTPLLVEHAHVVGHRLEQRAVPRVRGQYPQLERAFHAGHDEK